MDAGTRHLWTVLSTDERKIVRELLLETRRLWGWPENPTDDLGEYRGPVATLEDPRVIDPFRWRTVRPDFLQHPRHTAPAMTGLIHTYRLADGNYFDVFHGDIKPSQYSVPSVCPRAAPRLPPEVGHEDDRMAALDLRFATLKLIGPYDTHPRN